MNTYRPIHTEYKVIARVIQGDKHLKMSEDEFTQYVLALAYGELTEKRIREVYRKLQKEIR